METQKSPTFEEPYGPKPRESEALMRYSALDEKIVPIGKIMAEEIGSKGEDVHFRVPVFHSCVVSPEDVTLALRSPMFETWVENMRENDNILVTSITIQSVVFHSKSKVVKYVKLNSSCYARGPYVEWVKKGKDEKIFKDDIQKNAFIPGIALLRGPTIGVLVLLPSDEEDFVALTVQPRLAIGRVRMPELPTGAIDDTGDFVGESADLLDSQLGIRMCEMDLIDLTQLAFGDAFPGMYPSCGGCDEHVSLYLYHHKKHTRDELEKYRANFTGEVKKGDFMALKIVPIKELWKVSPDAKSLGALAIYNRLKQSGILP